MEIQDFLDMFLLISIFIGVLFLTFFATKKIAALNKRANFNKNMQVIEVLQLTQGQYLFIVKIATGYHLIGVGKENINYCIKLNENELDLEVQEEKFFHEYLSHFTKGKERKDHEKK